MTPVRTLSVRSIKPCLQVGERWNKVLEAVTELVDKKRHCRITPVISLTEQLQQTIVENWPRRHYSRYREVRALLTYWADPECPSLGVEKAAEKLAEVFGRLYGFDVQIWLIPTIGQPQQFLAVKLTDMVQSYGQDGTLLIFWYGGAVEPPTDVQGPVMWYGEKSGGKINSGIVPQILGSGKADVLTLYDCDHSLHGQNISSTGVVEHLGASQNRQMASFDSSGSFTRSLVKILDQPNSAAFGISVLDIHRKMVNRARLNATSPKLEDDSSSVYSQDTITAGSWLAPGALVYPVYCHLSTSPPRSKGKHSSIVLSNLNYPLEIEPSMINSDEMEVNIRMKLRSADTDIERWRNWLLEAPAEAVGVSISVT